jgi:hypothetical protein
VKRVAARGETLYHVAFECTFAARFWEAAMDMSGCKIPRLHPATWTRDLLSTEMCSKKDGAFIICGIWSMWNGRNARRHGRDEWSAKAAVKHIAAMVEELLCLEFPIQSKPQRAKAISNNVRQTQNRSCTVCLGLKTSLQQRRQTDNPFCIHRERKPNYASFSPLDAYVWQKRWLGPSKLAVVLLLFWVPAVGERKFSGS